VRSSGYPLVALSPSATIAVERTLFDSGGSIYALGPGATIRVTNSVIANLSGDGGAFIGTGLGGPPYGAVSVSFSTIINSVVTCGTGVPVCAGGTEAGSCVDNSVIFNGSASAPPNTVTGTACKVDWSIVYPQSAAVTGANNMLGVNPQLKDPA